MSVEIDRFHTSLDEMHKEVFNKSSKSRQFSVDAHNRKTGVKKINFSEGDFVLKGNPLKNIPKPSLRWNGPFLVLSCRDNYVFEIQNLLNKKKELAHGRRLKFFRNSDLHITEEIKEHLEYQENELLVVEDFEDLRATDNGLEVRVKWQQIDEAESDWVSYDSLKDDVPQLVDEFISDIKKSGTRKQKSLVQNL